jgi:hypothetical protein
MSGCKLRWLTFGIESILNLKIVISLIKWKLCDRQRTNKFHINKSLTRHMFDGHVRKKYQSKKTIIELRTFENKIKI